MNLPPIQKIKPPNADIFNPQIKPFRGKIPLPGPLSESIARGAEETKPAGKDGPIEVVTLLTTVSIQKESAGGCILTYDEVNGIRKLVPGQNPTRPSGEETIRFLSDVLEAAKTDYRIASLGAKMLERISNRIERDLNDNNELWNYATDRRLPQTSYSSYSLYGNAQLIQTLRNGHKPPRVNLFKDRRSVAKEEKSKPSDSVSPKNKVQLVTLFTSTSIQREYDGYTITYDETSGFRKLLPGASSWAHPKPSEAETERFKKDVAEAAGNDTAIAAFVKDNPALQLK